jgi:hypothetical protein
LIKKLIYWTQDYTTHEFVTVLPLLLAAMVIFAGLVLLIGLKNVNVSHNRLVRIFIILVLAYPFFVMLLNFPAVYATGQRGPGREFGVVGVYHVAMAIIGGLILSRLIKTGYSGYIYKPLFIILSIVIMGYGISQYFTLAQYTEAYDSQLKLINDHRSASAKSTLYIDSLPSSGIIKQHYIGTEPDTWHTWINRSMERAMWLNFKLSGKSRK